VRLGAPLSTGSWIRCRLALEDLGNVVQHDEEAADLVVPNGLAGQGVDLQHAEVCLCRVEPEGEDTHQLAPCMAPRGATGMACSA